MNFPPGITVTISSCSSGSKSLGSRLLFFSSIFSWGYAQTFMDRVFEATFAWTFPLIRCSKGHEEEKLLLASHRQWVGAGDIFSHGNEFVLYVSGDQCGPGNHFFLIIHNISSACLGHTSLMKKLCEKLLARICDVWKHRRDFHWHVTIS